jgi:hypothetical protein
VATATIAVPPCRSIAYAGGDEVLVATDDGVTFASVATATVTGHVELDHPAGGATLRGTWFTVYERGGAHNVLRACVP